MPKKNALPDENTLIELSELFKVFGDSTRVKILFLLFQKGEFSVKAISEELRVSQSATSHQLRILKNARLVKNVREGQSLIYSDTYDVKNPVLRTLMYFNPINYFINGYRKSFLYETAIFDSNYTTELIVFYGEFILLILIGSHFYKKLRKILPDIL